MAACISMWSVFPGLETRAPSTTCLAVDQVGSRSYLKVCFEGNFCWMEDRGWEGPRAESTGSDLGISSRISSRVNFGSSELGALCTLVTSWIVEIRLTLPGALWD